MENSPASKDERHHHHHRGKFSEGLIDQERVINALNIQPGQIILDAGCGFFAISVCKTAGYRK
jgi:precorrin-6B methylase 2